MNELVPVAANWSREKTQWKVNTQPGSSNWENWGEGSFISKFENNVWNRSGVPKTIFLNQGMNLSG